MGSVIVVTPCQCEPVGLHPICRSRPGLATAAHRPLERLIRTYSHNPGVRRLVILPPAQSSLITLVTVRRERQSVSFGQPRHQPSRQFRTYGSATPLSRAPTPSNRYGMPAARPALMRCRRGRVPAWRLTVAPLDEKDVRVAPVPWAGARSVKAQMSRRPAPMDQWRS